MPNFIPYLLLIICSVSLLTIVLFERKRYQTFSLYLSYSGMIFVFEIIITVVFNAYEYFPHIIKNRYHDSMLGATASNFFTVPCVGLLIAVYQLRARWILAFSLLFVCIEWLFLWLGIYEHHWWKVWYSFVSLLFYFWLTRLWIRKVNEGRGIFQYLSYFTYTYSLSNMLIFCLILLGVRRYQFGWFANVYRDDIVATNLTTLVFTLLIINVTYWTRKRRWVIPVWAALLLLQYILYRMGLLSIYINSWLYFAIYAVILMLLTWLGHIGLRSFRERIELPQNKKSRLRRGF